MNTTVFCAYRATGKSTFVDAWKDELKIADISGVSNENLSEEFEKYYGSVNIIFTDTSKTTREYLNKNNIDYVLIYPKKDMKEYYLCRMGASNLYSESYLKLIQKGWDNEFADLDQDVHRKVVLNFEDINTGIGMSIIKPFFDEEYICKDCLCPTCKSKECRNTNCGWCFNRKTVECNDYRK